VSSHDSKADPEAGLGPPSDPEVPEEIQVIPEHECIRLLEEHDLGRLAIVVDGRPQIFPVNYAVGPDSIAIRTAPGTKLAHGPMSYAALEIDGMDEVRRLAWSVVVKGTMHEVTNALGRGPEATRRLAVEPQAPGERVHWLAIRRDEVTGRRFRTGV